MAHAEHFLTRLDRLAGTNVELALQLYNDSGLLREVLADAPLPDGAERVAISLDDDTRGPFLIVTRDGHFVTCLGRGMRAGDLPVIARAHLNASARRLTRLREKLALAGRLEGERATRRLLKRLFLAADSLSREDFVEVASFEPLLGAAFLDTYVAMGAALTEQAPLLRNARLRGSKGKAALRDYWSLLHGAGHMALLGSMTADRERYVALTEGHEGARAAFSHPLTGTGVTAFILKGAWAAGRLGKLVLPEYKRALTRDVALFELFDTLFALTAIGTRSTKLRTEIRKALDVAPRVARTPQAQQLRDEMGTEVELVCKLAAGLLDTQPEDLEADLLRLGAMYLEPGRDPPDDPLGRDILRTIPLMSWADGITDGKKLCASLNLIAVTARGGPEQFYLPREAMSAFHEPWRPEHTRLVLEPLMKVERARRAPVARAEKVGRNAPCPCGSGRKHKRCCLA